MLADINCPRTRERLAGGLVAAAALAAGGLEVPLVAEGRGGSCPGAAAVAFDPDRCRDGSGPPGLYRQDLTALSVPQLPRLALTQTLQRLDPRRCHGGMHAGVH